MCKRVKETLPMQKYLFLIFLFVSSVIVSLSGCDSKNAAPYDPSFVKTFAELSLLYEKERMVNRVPDSLYQIKVAGFLSGKGMTREEFKKKVESLSADNEIWKNFIQDVTKSMDSIKAAATKLP